MLAMREETLLESVPLAPEATLADRITAVCGAQERCDEPRTLAAAFTAGDTVFLVFESADD